MGANGKGSSDRIRDFKTFTKRWDGACRHRPAPPGTTVYVVGKNGKLVPKGRENVFELPTAPVNDEYFKAVDDITKKVYAGFGT
jgi:hypothetical protein